jgi:4-amino-4-deoxy-L-arabinose transferase-like glycosyltransferase
MRIASRLAALARAATRDPERRIFAIFWLLSAFAYLFNLGLNDVWTPNEGFYADAARVMVEHGDWGDITFNQAPRFNKPPFSYWLFSLSFYLFGFSEWALRLPSALAGLGAAWLTYRLGAYLDRPRLGEVAGLVMLFSFQFVINARYASPEIILTFLFTLTLYWFVKGYHERSAAYLWGAYLALGLTLLTKGYPYLIIIGGIALLYMWWDVEGRRRDFFAALGRIRLLPGLALSVALGMSWVAYMLLTQGNDFYEVWMDETFRRAVSSEGGKRRWQPLFYLEANIWGFLPYSLTFYLALGHLLASRFRAGRESRALRLGLAWFAVMLFVFTLARGKIPTYFIQGHSGMSLATAWFMLHAADAKPWLRGLRAFTYWLPGVLFSLAGLGFVYFFEGHLAWIAVALAPSIALFIGIRRGWRYLGPPFFPFTAFLAAYLIFCGVGMPYMEKDYRESSRIGAIVRDRAPAPGTPLLIEDILVYNLPYYTGRLVVPYLSADELVEKARAGAFLALVRQESRARFPEAETLWEGLIYDYSETRTLEFILDVRKAKRGETSRFAPFCLLYQK